jgi:hypothetical protein
MECENTAILSSNYENVSGLKPGLYHSSGHFCPYQTHYLSVKLDFDIIKLIRYQLFC